MIASRKLVLVLLCVAGFVLSALLTTNSRAMTAQLPIQTKAEPRGLSASEKGGKAFYLRGETSSGQEITALVGKIDVPASSMTCGGCHGARGEGRTEGGVTAGNLTWSYLTKPYGHSHEGGRNHPAFSESSLIRSVTAGIDPGGNKLSVAKPALSNAAIGHGRPDSLDGRAEPGLTSRGKAVSQACVMREIGQPSVSLPKFD